MLDGHRSGRSTGRVSCKSTELKYCSMIEMHWNEYEVSLTSHIIHLHREMHITSTNVSAENVSEMIYFVSELAVCE